MLRKLRQIDKSKKLIRYRFDLRQLNVGDCHHCLFIYDCKNELIPKRLITLYDLCYQLNNGKHKLIYVSEKGIESIKGFCK